MGFFSGKKKKKFTTAVQRMIEDDAIVLSSKAAITNYLHSSGVSASTNIFGKGLPDYIIEATQNAMPAKYNRAYRLAAQGRYAAFGLPKAETASRAAIDVPARVQDAIEAELGVPVTLLYAQLEEANYYHVLWQKLVDDYGLNTDTNELETLSLSKGTPCYLTKAVLHFSQPTLDLVLDSSYLDQWGLSTEFGQTPYRSRDLDRPLLAYEVDAVAVEDYVIITYEYQEVISDTTPPNQFNVNSFDGTTLQGIGEIGATINVCDIADVVLASGVTDAVGYCEIVLGTTTTDIYIRVIDTALNESVLNHITAPYTDTTNFGVGDTPTQTVFRVEETVTAQFLDYFDSNDETNETYVENADYIMASYTYDTDKVGFLTYAYGSNTRPELEGLFNLSDAAGEFYPRMYVRLNETNLAANLAKTDPMYKDSVRLGKALGMSWTGVSESIHEGLNSIDGVSINEIKQTFVMVGAPMNTEDAYIREYLFRYFQKIYTEDESPIEPPTPSGTRLPFGVRSIPDFNIKIGQVMNVKDNVYTQTMYFASYGLKRVTGVVTTVGGYSSSYVEAVQVFSGFRSYTKNEPSYHSYIYQDQADSYLEVRVYGATTQHSFSGGSTTQSNRDEALIIAVDKTIMPKMTQPEKEFFIAKCLYMFINVLKIIKEKWYQRGAFKFIMAVIAIVVSIVFPPAGAAAYSGWAAIAYSVAYAVVVSVAISVAVKVLTSILVSIGVDARIIAVIAVVVAVVALAYGDSSSLAELLDVSANTLLQVSNAAFQVAAGMQSYQLNEVVKQMDAFAKEAQSKWDLIDKAKEMLETGMLPLSLETLMSDLRSKVMINLGESADTFLTRTIGLGNVGTLGFEMVSSYVDTKLTLPKLSYTMNLTQRG